MAITITRDSDRMALDSARPASDRDQHLKMWTCCSCGTSVPLPVVALAVFTVVNAPGTPRAFVVEVLGKEVHRCTV
jgi:hypothetical protein